MLMLHPQVLATKVDLFSKKLCNPQSQTMSVFVWFWTATEEYSAPTQVGSYRSADETLEDFVKADVQSNRRLLRELLRAVPVSNQF